MLKITPGEFHEIQSLMYRLCGLVLSDDKQYLAEHRLHPVLSARRLSSFAEYLQLLKQPGAAALQEELVEHLTTAETSFFRDGHPFEALRRRILPDLRQTIRSRSGGGLASMRTLQILSVACSTGQEPYSLAMVVRDWNEELRSRGEEPIPVRIVAMDVSRRCLVVARTGRYSTAELQRGVSDDIRDRHFQAMDADWVVREELRTLVEFRQQNLLHPFSGSSLWDLILCRNVLIYFDARTRQEICSRLTSHLHHDGCFLIGAAENLLGLNLPLSAESCGQTTFYRRLG